MAKKSLLGRAAGGLLVLGVWTILAACSTARAAAQNLLPNPTFDTSISGWTTSNVSMSLSYAATHDAGNSSGSGSLMVVNSVPTDNGGNSAIAIFCFSVVPGQTYHAGASFFFPGGQAFAANEAIFLLFHSSASCQGSIVGETAPIVNAQPDRWQRLDTQPVQAPAGAASVLLEFTFRKIGDGGSLTAFLDNAVFEATSDLCESSDDLLCIAGRFKVHVSYQTSQAGGLSGFGHALPLTALGITRGGAFWFFSPENPEILIKVLDACALNQKFWVYYSAGTNVGLTTTVTDMANGHQVTYTNNDRTAAPPVQDVNALACP